MKDDANNYHPIIFVPALSEILEKIIATQLISFLDKHNILNLSLGSGKINPQMMQLTQLLKI
jgi:hypothetical protein